MKTLNYFAIIGLFAGSMILVSCSKDEVADPFYTGSSSNTKVLSPIEKEGLLSLAEFQKMHLDVYTQLAEKSTNPLFVEFGRDEEILLDLLSIRIDKYGLFNPLINNGPGEYEDSRIQAIYDEFVSSNYTGDYQMLIYAKQMEEELISEIGVHMPNVTGNTDIINLYTDLNANCITTLDVIVSELKANANTSQIVNPVDEF